MCLSVCLKAYLWNRWTDRRKICCADPLWPWLGPPLAALWYVMYFCFYGWLTFCRNQLYGASGGQILGWNLMSMNALFLVCDQGSLAGLCMQDYRSLCAAVTICGALVNIQTHRQCALSIMHQYSKKLFCLGERNQTSFQYGKWALPEPLKLTYGRFHLQPPSDRSHKNIEITND